MPGYPSRRAYLGKVQSKGCLPKDASDRLFVSVCVQHGPGNPDAYYIVLLAPEARK